jgi:hypothetical protein
LEKPIKISEKMDIKSPNIPPNSAPSSSFLVKKKIPKPGDERPQIAIL